MAIQSDAVLRFITRVNQANRSRSKDVVLTLEEANSLSAALAATFAEHSDLQRRVIDLMSNGGAPIEIGMDGGGFR